MNLKKKSRYLSELKSTERRKGIPLLEWKAP